MSTNLINDFDEIFGLDIISFEIGDEKIVGYFSNSPIEERLVKMYNYIPEISNKPYRAHWLVEDSKLLLMYINGIINGVRLYTTEIVPEYPDDTVFFLYSQFSGQLKIDIKQEVIHPIFVPYLISERELLLTFENGILE
jgi:hypothetical protein